ncbi:acetyl-CoA carboxylase biotin carboxylase subunit [Zhenhengia yiwuensis]|uniref:acetyl-CoA carboxylase biotin carboxylase subunit n=1 Tax=Zhenhengia yiwuensis TaxID=2763666 RepID=UPI0015A914FC|nr:acetyl-CoA carboxylase biotin carboxylase subunit [Zhenhengia yiwuensis]MDY3367881.1 acetyl-CoA carboxylase biotin carboxylase subunit [Zhenhengia yiwuensis]
MISKVLVANRGEIAVRIIRACREMNIETVAIYSTADKDSLHVKLADEAVCIGKPLPRDSYLNIESIITAAVLTGVDAIHPGFGFLSENAKFARICRECNIKFIGPTPEMIELMGDKARARQMMIEADVPVVPGSEGTIDTAQDARVLAKCIGYPVILKAVAGGGGRGMRIVWNESEIEMAFNTARNEALSAFGDGSMYLEKYIVEPRHIEFQILGDAYGNVVHLGERDCSLQRRHQKVIEEAPSPCISPALRKKMGEAAIRAAKAVKYENAGTIEFILDKDRNFFFIEMNTRIQVEHPVTEMITGIDLIREQIRIASGERLQFTNKDIQIKGHAIECRINAENPKLNFRPCAGKIVELHLPGGRGVRVDTAIYPGYSVPPTYDSMLAKIIAYGDTREEALSIMRRALAEAVIEGIDTNIDFQYDLIHTDAFNEGYFDTSFIEKNLDSILGEE